MTDLLNEIIPPSDYQHRNGFSNDHIIDSLNASEKTTVEIELIKLLEQSDDTLIGDTLAYMGSADSLPILQNKLNASQNPNSKILWANFIFRIKHGDNKMKDIAFDEFQKVSGKYNLIPLFHTLASFRDPRINDIIKGYQDDKDYLIAYNARTALGRDTKELIARERSKNKCNKPWWKFW